MHQLSSGRDRFTYDFIVDGVSLAETLQAQGLVGCLDVTHMEFNARAVQKLLRAAPPDIQPNRVMLYVCSECGDLACGAITAAIKQPAGEYAWSDFRLENGYDKQMTKRLTGIGRVHFAAPDYEALLHGVAAAD